VGHGVISEVIPAAAEDVFDLVHDYARRLSWDTLLSAAYLDDGFVRAEKGATSVCVGRRSLGRLALKTIYLTFERPSVAAVKMVNSPPLLDAWAASIRHAALEEGWSRITYTFQFTTKPRCLRWLLEPIATVVFRWETRKRLLALRDHFARRRTSGAP
jgi:hypothetical protein